MDTRDIKIAVYHSQHSIALHALAGQEVQLVQRNTGVF